MLNLAKILVPVDFSDRSIAAARYAGALACRCGSETILLHVVPNDYPVGGFEAPIDLPAWWSDRMEEAQKKLDSFLAEEFGRMPVKRMAIDGDPAARIVEVAHSEGVNLIVMPTRGFGPFRRFLLGSVAAKVLHDADTAVLTSAHIETDSPERLAFRTVLCALDLGPQSRAALAWAVDLAAKFESKLHIVHALPPLEPRPARYFDEEFQLTLERNAREQIYALMESVGKHADVQIEHGTPASVVRTAAEAVGADCVVIGRHSNSGILGRLHADAYSIVRESPCPVVSV